MDFYQFDDGINEIYKKLNNNNIIEDKYNILNIKNSIKNEILNIFQEENVKIIINEWINKTNISIEEMLYCIVLIDKSLNSINEKLFLLYSIGQTKNKLLFNNNGLSIVKMKEMIYSLYKRFMIYFTKTDIERMIDFILKDERLFNIKYAFIYNKNDIEKINEFIYDKDRYEPKIDNKKPFEIFFDNIDKQLNIYLNHLNNHYNINSIPKDLLIFILNEILKNNNNLNKYIQNGFNALTLVIEKDNILFKRNYTIKYSPIRIEEEDIDGLINVEPKENHIIDFQLCN